jgi:hypothetical protein
VEGFQTPVYRHLYNIYVSWDHKIMKGAIALEQEFLQTYGGGNLMED